MHYLLLDPTWKPRVARNPENILPSKVFNFPAGEAHVKLGPLPTNPDTGPAPGDIQVCHRFRKGDEMLLMLAAGALRTRYGHASLSVYLPYLPYARQDREMVSGEPFSLKVFIQLLAAMEYRELCCVDPHNAEVTGALCAAYGIRLHKVSTDLLGQAVDREGRSKDFVLVSPDAGASKKIALQAEEIKYTGPIFQGEKKRDLSTGRIVRYEVYGPLDQLQGKTAVIRDDICSKGGTFKLLATSLKEKGASRVVLVVSHWENTANRRELFEAGIAHIYTTNSLADLDPAQDAQAGTENFFTQFPL